MNSQFRVWDGETMHAPPHDYILDNGLCRRSCVGVSQSTGREVYDIREARSCEVMPATGLSAEGTPIYGGDIVEAMDHMGLEGDPALVYYDADEAAWCAGKHWFLGTFVSNWNVRVVGNKYENPDLLTDPPSTTSTPQ